MPTGAIDFSSSSIKYMEAKLSAEGYIPFNKQKIDIDTGVIIDGAVADEEALIEYLSQLKTKRKFVSISIPGERAFLFTVPVKHADESIEDLVNFSLDENVPLDSSLTIADYELIQRGGKTFVSVVAYEDEVIQSYIRPLSYAGFEVVRVEPESFAIARSVAPNKEGTFMIIDIGANRTNIIVSVGSVPVFSANVNFGMREITEKIMNAYNCSLEEAYDIQNHVGIQTDNKTLKRDIKIHIKEMVQEISKHYNFWDSRRDKNGNRIERIENVFLSGGGGALLGLKEEISSKLHVYVEHANVWQHLFDLNKRVPKISRTASLQYAATAGLLVADINSCL